MCTKNVAITASLACAQIPLPSDLATKESLLNDVPPTTPGAFNSIPVHLKDVLHRNHSHSSLELHRNRYLFTGFGE
jgi:hypothetical protein